MAAMTAPCAVISRSRAHDAAGRAAGASETRSLSTTTTGERVRVNPGWHCGDVCSMSGLPPNAAVEWTCYGPLPCACESDVALPESCQRDVPGPSVYRISGGVHEKTYSFAA